MKRSEMIKKIKKSFNDMDDQNSLTDYGAELHLRMLEEAGMLPPATDWLIDNHPEKMIWAEVHDYHLWEPEEEPEEEHPRSGAV